jgi:PhnB protein
MTTLTPYLLYTDCEAALSFLSQAFGFEEVLRYVGEEGYINHAEMKLGDAHIYLGNPGPSYRNPRQLGAATVGLSVVIDDGIDELCERARAAGADITEEPTDQDYGERRFMAKDPEGHLWFMGQVIRELDPEDWGATRAART